MASPKALEAIEPVDDSQFPVDDGQDAGSMTKIIHNAKAATDKEQKMTLLQGLKLYPKAAMWSILISTCIAMEGYDICLVNNFYGFPQFQKKYGEQMPDGGYQVTAPVCLSPLSLCLCIRGMVDADSSSGKPVSAMVRTVVKSLVS